MDKILYLTLLYDFYGELLTDKQKEIFEMYHLNDLSMQEIGEQFHIKRQSVNDILKRTEKILEEYECKLCLVRDYTDKNEKIGKLISDIDLLLKNNDTGKAADSLMNIRRELLEINSN